MLKFIKRLAFKAFIRASLKIENASGFIERLSYSFYPFASINQLDRKLAVYAPELLSASTFYIEVGANDGLRQSNTLFLEKIWKASGLLIEASPILYEKLLNNRSPRNIFSHCALVSSTYDKPYVELQSLNLMTMAISANPYSLEDQMAKSAPHVTKPTFKFLAPSSTLDSILKIHDIGKIDLLSLDVEGYEINVLDGIDFDRVSPKYILIETSCLEQVISLLRPHSYALVAQLSHHDYLFKKSP